MPADILTVSELNRQARLLLEQRFPLLWVSGEISNLTRAASGHVYFSLKDSQAQVRCVMFRSRAQLLPWQLENGQQVEVQALVTLYEARGDFQLNVEAMRRAGVGRLYELFVRLREKLAGEGLFDAARKRELPRFPRRVGIVTSPQAAALQDVIATFLRRAPHVELIIYPTLVQGAAAPAAIVAALARATARNECDVLLIVRGGGSIEDLWAFNDEAVARAIAAHCGISPAPTSAGVVPPAIPIIAGIGHETDLTIADYVADRRAATPTAAAELASAGWFAATQELAELAKSLRHTMQLKIEARMQAVDRLALRLIHPAQRLAASRQRLELLGRRLHTAGQLTARREALAKLQLRLARARPVLQPAHQHLDRLTRRLRQAMITLTAAQRDRLTRCSGALAALSPTATLQRGYSITHDNAGRIVRDAAQLAAGDKVRLQFAVGAAIAVVANVDETQSTGNL
ncbi:MAG: exodeoxyribonuclease VII large subunit [Gammaproteobacteria bacterium]|nr:exodeoxyribonuclease VII large subunit [Rhodocyclaceae bacterium]MBU3908451.1 exodeoxyribonuclease VII large subunit [Gammaproteobacteria bacterium]MBU3989310.1 exodeoxyribonuclease VII large subunit [Gammaproteobacteria bacterium]MBU4005397.1 exodeoxyribonuclease VII large subunit [Gammaproteobacteria bacterium]MBU4021082.1 exodeoxyribonuclease VII large subunit [Gammaproteobacteria bacterium]